MTHTGCKCREELPWSIPSGDRLICPSPAPGALKWVVGCPWLLLDGALSKLPQAGAGARGVECVWFFSQLLCQGPGSVGRGVAGPLPHHVPAGCWEASALPLGLQITWEGFPSPICQQPLGCSPQLARDVGRGPKSGGICTQPPNPRGLAGGPACPPPSAIAQPLLYGGGAALLGVVGVVSALPQCSRGSHQPSWFMVCIAAAAEAGE